MLKWFYSIKFFKNRALEDIGVKGSQSFAAIFNQFQRREKKQKGMASVEAIVSIYIFVILVIFSLGFFGVVHTGIVNSIAARTYAFNTFENRTHLIYHRGSSGNPDRPAVAISHRKKEYRLHGITSENPEGVEWIVTERHLAFATNPANFELNQTENQTSHLDMTRREKDGVNVLERGGQGNRAGRPRFNPVWVKATYGICLNARCGDGI